MKKLLLATTCLALSSVAVMAADLPIHTKAPLIAAPVFSWTGCYVGANVGGGATTNTNTQNNNFEGSGISGAQGHGTGAIAGGQLGCNYQDGNWVFGLEGEGFWSGIKGTTVQSGNGLESNVFRDATTVKNTNDFTIAARAGIAFDRTLIYGKGGWAWGNYKVNSSDTAGFVGSPTAFTNATSNQSGYLNGLLVGVGIEHALTRNWTVKAEYDYIAFGSRELAINVCQGTPAVCAQPGTASISSTKQLFKVGVNYLFDFGGAPLVAKY